MGRTLDSLKKSNGTILRPDWPPSSLLHKDHCVTESAVSDEHAPYIEVGGPGKLVEGSADVLAATPPSPSSRRTRPPRSANPVAAHGPTHRRQAPRRRPGAVVGSRHALRADRSGDRHLSSARPPRRQAVRPAHRSDTTRPARQDGPVRCCSPAFVPTSAPRRCS